MTGAVAHVHIAAHSPQANVGPERRGGAGVRDTFNSGTGGSAAARQAPKTGPATALPGPPPSDGPPTCGVPRPDRSPESNPGGNAIRVAMPEEGDPPVEPVSSRPLGGFAPPEEVAAAPSSLPPVAPLRSVRSRPAPLRTSPAAAAVEDTGLPSGAPLSPAAALLRGVPAGYAPVPPASMPPPMATVAAPSAPEEFESDSEDRSIKLGLGDFVFYSVLVSRAALFDMTTFMACLVSVLVGLGGTLLLLGLYKKALPAVSAQIGVTSSLCDDIVHS